MFSCRFDSLVPALFVVTIFSASRLLAATEPVDGTTGIPMGGVGAGAVKFCPHLGTFEATAGTPVAHADFASMNNTCLQFFSEREGTIATSDLLKSVQANNRYDDDAFFPVEYANLGVINNVTINLTAFSPVDLSSLDRMSYPYAFFYLRLTNTASTEVSAACALQLGTDGVPIGEPGKGLRTSGGIEYAVYGDSSDSSAIVSYGSDSGFASSGQCNNTPRGNVNKIAVKVTLEPNETKYIKFVMAWYNGVQGEANFTDRYHYVNIASTAGDFADLGLKNFDVLMNNAVSLATRMRASNLPEWLKNQTMNSLCNLSNNWTYTKDGRMASAEGGWPYMGTMDQMWHARQIFIAICPDMIWQELEYWARTQKDSPVGQIHHDFCVPDGGSQSLVQWDDKQHGDYRDIDDWVDLNCGFIISFYEAFIATNDQAKLAYFWPYLQKAGQRILTQSAKFATSKYPGTFSGSGSTYDAGGDSDAYNSGISIVAYTIMSQLSALEGDSSMQATYDRAADDGKKSFQARWLDPKTNNFPYGRIAESILAGQEMGYFLKFNSFFPKADLDYGISVLTEYYDPVEGLHHPAGTYDEWAQYMMVHMGGLLLQTGHLQEWRGLQYDYYQRCYSDRDTVFNNSLGIPKIDPTYPATNFSGGGQYISYPDLWRNYYDIIGFHRNKVTGELWVEPHIPDEMKHVLNQGLFLSPEGQGEISSTESGGSYQNQDITIKTDSPMAVTKLYVKDLYGTNVTVKINGTDQTFSRIGTGYGRRLQINWAGTIPPTGIHIVVTGDSEAPSPEVHSAFDVILAKEGTPLSGASIQEISDNGGTTGASLAGNGSCIGFPNVDFGTEADSLQIRASGSGAGNLEAHLDSPTGTLLGTCALSGTEDLKTWQTATSNVSGANGIHSVYVVASGKLDTVFNVNWIKFSRSVFPGKFENAFDQMDAEDYTSMSGDVGLQACTDPTNGTTVDYIKNGAYLHFSHVDFGTTVPEKFEARVSSASSGGNIEVHLDSPTGPLLGICTVTGTNGWDSWATVSCPVTGEPQGIHAVYLVFTGGAGYLFNVNWFQFEP